MERRFKKARIDCNIKMVDAAKMFDVVQSTVSAWESGRKEPSFEIVKKMAEVYKVSVEYLLGYDSFEMLSAKEKIPKESIALFHAKPVWVQGKGWALLNATDNTLIYVNESPEKIGNTTELYFAPPPYTETSIKTDVPLTIDELCKQSKVLVEPISNEPKLRELLRGTYEIKGEYVENSRGSRFHFDNYKANWVAFKVE